MSLEVVFSLESYLDRSGGPKNLSLSYIERPPSPSPGRVASFR